MANKNQASQEEQKQLYTVNPKCDIGGYVFEDGLSLQQDHPVPLTDEAASQYTDSVRGHKVLVKYPVT